MKSLVQPKYILGVMFAVLAIFLAAKTFCWKCPLSSVPQKLENSQPVYGSIPPFSLTKQDGEKFSLSDLKGKVWIADFIFTRCAGACPLMSNKMRALEDKLADAGNIRLVSFIVDPDHDTPEVLARYSERFKTDPKRWVFLTGDRNAVFQLAEQHFHLGVAQIPAEEREAADQTVRHSSKFVLVDQKAQIRGYYDSDSEGSMQKLVDDARALVSPMR